MEATEEDQEQTKVKKAIELNLNTSTNSSNDSQESSKSTPNQSKARTYDCTFCKKGFSNAQALGGHMNIHRKDKAKLRQNITKTTTHHQVQQQQNNYGNNLDNPKLLKPSSYSPMNSSPEVNWPLFLSHVKETSEGSKEKKQVEKVQLPLVFETSQVPEVGQHGSSGSELDLELRLGPEPRTPPEDSSTKLGTRKFF